MSPDATPTLPSGPTGVRYSLNELLRELKAERTSGAMAFERLDQAAISKLIKAKRARRDKA